MRYLAGYSHFKKFFVADDLLLNHEGLPHVLVLVVHLGDFGLGGSLRVVPKGSKGLL